jgi:3-dehydroquinate synthase
VKPRPDVVAAVAVGAGTGTYPVLVGSGLLGRLPDLLLEYAPVHRYGFICDERVAELYGEASVARVRDAGLRADLFTFPMGEASKTRKTWSILTDRLLEAGLGRDAAVVALGGGVTGDLAGFVAATYLRGVPVVQVPTSLVAMIDASVGGKTGVDVRAGKNLVGAFHPPKVVIADPDTIATLPRAERAQGLAEAVKHGAVLDEAYYEALLDKADQLLDAEPTATRNAVFRSVEIKAKVVTKDERESGFRQVLNFGHTLGHALETASGYELRHGSAVAVGMILEARLGEAVGVTADGTADRLAEGLQRFGLGGLSGYALNTDEVVGFLDTDKKVRKGRARYVLLERVGAAWESDGWSHPVPEGVVRTLVEGFLEGDDPGGGS